VTDFFTHTQHNSLTLFLQSLLPQIGAPSYDLIEYHQ